MAPSSVTDYNEDALPAYTPMPWYVDSYVINNFFQLELNDIRTGRTAFLLGL